MPVPNIRSIKGNLATLLSITDFKSVNALMKAKPDLKTRKEADEYLINNWRDFKANVDSIEKEEKQKEQKKQRAINKRNKVIQDVIKRNQEIQEQIQNKRNERLNAVKTFNVHIVAKIKTFWKKTGKTINGNEDFEEALTSTMSQLGEKIEGILASYFPFEDEYRLTTLVSYTYQIIEDKPKVNKLDVPMKRADVLRLSFLKYFNKINPISYEDHQGKCVLEILKNHLNIKKDKTITDVMEEASRTLYTRNWKIEDGITARMILYFCKEKNIPCLGFDQKNKLFVKYVRDENKIKKYNSLIFIQAVGHFYIINDTDTVRHISQSFKENVTITTSILQEDREKINYNYVNAEDILIEEDGDETRYLDYCEMFNKIDALEENTVILFKQGNLNEELKEYMKLYDTYPDVKYESLSNVRQIKMPNKVILTTTDCIIDNKTVRDICFREKIEYKNQSIGTLNNDLLDKHFNTERKRFSKEERNAIKESQNGLCNLCNEPIKKQFQIDHKRPLSNGGNNETDNLQALCVSCHQEKTKEENLNCEHYKVKDYISCYNIEAYNAIKSKFFTKVQFSQFLLPPHLINEYKEKYSTFGIDDNRCRKNILLHYGYNFPVYSSLDNIKPFNIFNKTIDDGYYYVETDNVFPMRKNGFYSRPMIEFCLQENIISKSNIKYEYKPSFAIESDYFKSFVEYLMTVYPEEYQKLSVNALIGMFGRRDNSYVDSQICGKDNVEDLGAIYSQYQKPYLNDINEKFYAVTAKINIDKLENAYPIYAQILDCEAIEAYKKVQMLEENGAIPICVKTDAIVYYANEAIDIENYFWDKEKTIKKYKSEKPSLLKKSIKYSNTDKFKITSIKYDVIEDTKEFDFNIKVAKDIIDGKKSCFLDGPAGSGKTHLVNEIIRLIGDDDKIIRLTPTNVSALLIGGQTIDKFGHSHLNNSKSINKLKSKEYIFIDEVSMMRELFYSIFLSVKFHHPHIKFIISGDFNQLEPVNDRATFNYENSKALHELVDGNKVLLTLCRRSDDRLFNLCKNIKENKPHKIGDLCKSGIKTYKNICFTNKCRREVNEECMNRFLQEHSEYKTYDVSGLSYDKNTQNYTLCKGMPLISRLNMKSVDVLNNEMFVCDKINENDIEVSNGMKKLTIPKNIFNRLFLLAFCITTHKSQGLSFNEKYSIYEYQKFSKKLKYVALSRATKYEHIYIAK